ncbi:ABC transporter permease [Hydrogenimonas urashimensis]|uniref:ABC transporter permease n=1 Tax=Hydrogenimonas urashimensis TaxID=2740515 RepID=UPI001914EFF2|nr:iron ABC transporter permease [Hydrogenimonas urashimensis]
MPFFLGLVGAILLLAGILPVALMLYQTFTTGSTASPLMAILFSSQALAQMHNSLTLAFLVTASTMSVGVPLGLVLGKTDLPMRHFFTFLFLVPLLMPPYILAVAWDALFTYLHLPSSWLFGLTGTAFVLFCVYLSLPVLLTALYLRTIHPHLEEAGRLAAGWPAVLRYITLPSIRHGLLLAALLVFLLTLGEFSVPMYFRYDVYAVESFTRFAAFYDISSATAAGLSLVIFALLLILLENRYLRERTAAPSYIAAEEEFLRIALGPKAKIIISAILVLFVSVFLFLPFFALIHQGGGTGPLALALTQSDDALLRSLLYAFGGAFVLTFVGFFTGYFSLKSPYRPVRMLDPATLFLFALPGTVVGIALVVFWNRPITGIVYTTPLILLLGYLAKYTALTSRICMAKISMIPPSMEEAAQMAGAGWFQRILHVVSPLAADGIAGAWIVAYLFIFRDTAMTMILYPPGKETLPVRIFTLMANGRPDTIATLSLLMAAAIVLPAAATWGWFFVRKGIR